MTKQFYSCVDSLIPCPQPEQHLVIESMARRLHGKITYSTSEDTILRSTQAWIEERVDRIKNINGLIFFQIDQFNYNNKLNLKLIKNLLDKNLEVHFAREAISFYSTDDLYTSNSINIILFINLLFEKNNR